MLDKWGAVRLASPFAHGVPDAECWSVSRSGQLIEHGLNGYAGHKKGKQEGSAGRECNVPFSTFACTLCRLYSATPMTILGIAAAKDSLVSLITSNVPLRRLGVEAVVFRGGSRAGCGSGCRATCWEVARSIKV